MQETLRQSRASAARWLVLPALALAFLAGSSWVPAARTAEGETVRATRIELVDESGRVRAQLGLRDGQPTLSFFDEEGRERAVLGHGDDATGLSILDDSETVRVGVMQFAHGGGGIALHGSESRGAAVLYYKEQGSLTFYDREGAVIERRPSD